MNRAKITYRFDHDGATSPIEETAADPVIDQADATSAASVDERGESVRPISRPPEGRVIPLYQEDAGFGGAQRYGAWRSPFDEETERIERMIREADYSANHPETEESPPQQRASSYYEYTDDAPLYPRYRKIRKRSGLFGLLTTAAGAVITGVMLGMFVLSLFRGDSPPPNVQDHSAVNAPQEGSGFPADLGLFGGETDDIPGEDLIWTDFQLPERTYYLVQIGVFSSEEGAELAASQLRDKGLAGAVEEGAMLSVFAGVAEHRDDALLISHHLQNEGLEVYVKPYVLPAVSQLGLHVNAPDEVRQYAARSRELTGLMIAATMQHISEAQPAAIPEEQMKQLKSVHQQWTETANQTLADEPESSKAIVSAMNTALNSAMVSLEQYNKQPSAAYLWQVQTAVTEHLIGQRQWLSGLQ